MEYRKLILWRVDKKLRDVKRFLLDKLVIKKVKYEFDVWKTVKLGLRKSPEEYCEALESGGYATDSWSWGPGMFNKLNFKTALNELEVDIVKVKVSELGFKKDVQREQIYNRAKELGLELCPPEIGSQLRLQYPDQPKGESIFIGMEPITSFVPIIRSISDIVFVVRHLGSKLTLEGDWGSPHHIWRPNNQWVFVRPRPRK